MAAGRVRMSKIVDLGVYGLSSGGDLSAAATVAGAVRDNFPPLTAFVAPLAHRGNGLLVWQA